MFFLYIEIRVIYEIMGALKVIFDILDYLSTWLLYVVIADVCYQLVTHVLYTRIVHDFSPYEIFISFRPNVERFIMTFNFIRSIIVKNVA